MKREIKFRAWVPKRKRMIFFWLFGTDEGYHIQEQEQLEECEIMQFTGLKDQNGKEIYEGDLIVWSTVSDRIREVCHFGSSFKIHGGSIHNIDDCNPEKEFEIVGNIHKNPELLNPKQ